MTRPPSPRLRRLTCLGLVLVCGLAGLPMPQVAAVDPPAASPVPALPTLVVLIKGNLFTLDVADTPARRERGLMERRQLPADRGMLFVFPDQTPRRFWMKNTRLDLDIVYLDETGAVVSTATMLAEPPRGRFESEAEYEERLPFYASAGPARCAIEFRSGTLALLALEPGERLALDLAPLLARAR